MVSGYREARAVSEWALEASKYSLAASEQSHGGKELLEVTWWLLDDNWGGQLGIFHVTWLLLEVTAGLLEVSLNLQEVYSNSDDHKRDPIVHLEPFGGQL